VHEIVQTPVKAGLTGADGASNREGARGDICSEGAVTTAAASAPEAASCVAVAGP
jgi:hypothetical protein